MKNKCLLLSTFCSFQTPLTLLTYSALWKGNEEQDCIELPREICAQPINLSNMSQSGEKPTKTHSQKAHRQFKVICQV